MLKNIVSHLVLVFITGSIIEYVIERLTCSSIHVRFCLFIYTFIENLLRFSIDTMDNLISFLCKKRFTFFTNYGYGLKKSKMKQ